MYHPIVSCPRRGRFVEELQKIGVETEIVSYHRKILALSRSGNGIHIWGRPFSLLSLAPTILTLKNLINDKGIHLIVTNGIKCHFMGSIVSSITRTKLVWHVRDVIEPGWLKWMAWSVGRFSPDKIITNSRAVGSVFSNNGKTETIYNGIDLPHFNPRIDGGIIRSEFKIGKDTKLIGTVGHLAPLKGYEELVGAIGEVLRGGFDVKLAVVGDAIYPHSKRYQQRLLSLLDSSGLEDRVIFTGFREDIQELLASFDIFVLPSRSEGFGRANLEAMAMGKPVISTNVGGVPEVVLDGVTGILVPPGNSNALFRAIVRLLDDPHMRETMGREGRKRVEERFTLQGHVQRIQEIYRDVLRTP
jgi:glycosyltransferase involved in cell wall biosynthesis